MIPEAPLPIAVRTGLQQRAEYAAAMRPQLTASLALSLALSGCASLNSGVPLTLRVEGPAQASVRVEIGGAVRTVTVRGSETLTVNPGTYTLTPQPVDGWDTPGARQLGVTGGGDVTFTYQSAAQATRAVLTVFVTGPARADVRVQGAGFDQTLPAVTASGRSLTLEPGTYTVTGVDTLPWRAPTAQTVTLNARQTLDLTLNYGQAQP